MHLVRWPNLDRMLLTQWPNLDTMLSVRWVNLDRMLPLTFALKIEQKHNDINSLNHNILCLSSLKMSRFSDAFRGCRNGTWAKWVKGALLGLGQFLAIESPLKSRKIYFYFTSKALFVLKIFRFLSWFFGHEAKRLD